MTFIKFITIWTLISIVVSPLIGAFLGFNDREVNRNERQGIDRTTPVDA